MMSNNETEVIYLTDFCGDETGNGTLELTEDDHEKVPYEEGPGDVSTCIVQIGHDKYVLGDLAVDHKDDAWAGDDENYPSKTEARVYCEEVCEFIRPQLKEGMVLLPIEDRGEGYLTIRVAIALDGLKDRVATIFALRQAFGVMAFRPDLPFTNIPTTAGDGEVAQVVAGIKQAIADHMDMTWGE